MGSTLIDLSAIKCRQSGFKAPPTNDDQEVYNLCIHYFKEQRAVATKLFNEWLEEINSDLVTQIDDFIDTSLRYSKNGLFSNRCPAIIHPARVVLGMDSGDNNTTLDMIYNHVSCKNRNLKIVRVAHDTTQKNPLIDILKKATCLKQLLIIVDQTELMESSLLETLVRSIIKISQESKGPCIMIMFCMANGMGKGLSNVMDLLFHSFMRDMTWIMKKNPKKTLALQDKLLKSDVNRFRLGRGMIEFMYDSFSQYDASMAQFRYLYEYALFEYHMNPLSLLTTDKKHLMNVVKPHSNLVESIRRLESVRKMKGTKVDWNSAPSIIQFCVKSIKDVLTHHEFLVSQIGCYLPLIKDEIAKGFPSNIIEIYDELWDYDSLSLSPNFMNAIIKLSKYPTDSILRRIEASVANSSPVSLKEINSVASILSNYREKLENNEDCKNVKEGLRTQLFGHAALLKSPKTYPLYEAVYFDNRSAVYKRTETHARTDLLYSEMKHETHYGILLNLIHNSTTEISLADLFDDFKDAVEGSNQINDDLILKTIFQDLIDSMELQNLIKTETRRSRKGLISRVIWF